MPIRIRLILAALVAASLMPLASVTMPTAAGIAPIVILVVRELAIGLILSFATAIVVGAVMTAGSVIGGSMELNSGAVLRANVEIAQRVIRRLRRAWLRCDSFVGGFHRMLILALARSLYVAPLGMLSLPDPHRLIGLGGRVFALGLALSFPVSGSIIRPFDHAGGNRATCPAGEYPGRRTRRNRNGGPGAPGSGRLEASARESCARGPVL